ncbi:heavy-metal-associated domain-containing protein [Brumimicrobium glaciale]|uniref:Heavy-metal-associated domain-containing protein n=1 Tax=Brumimicrobium glaciale TaxID=200475 RepID=A0A4Q4KRB6_9FLAO|nr:heavy-metal-associated domain-containing protein [Brumimicrobium glaciale]RYM36090.1 heavy-metal-associated domain-containing protein [Brumimicrobium glaciale]
MTIVSENVIPGNHGKVFGTNAENRTSLNNIKKAILRIDGIRDVLIDEKVFPIELTVHTNDVVSIKEIQKAAISVGFHLIPKGLFPL